MHTAETDPRASTQKTGSQPVEPIVLRVPEVAHALRCTTQHVRNLIAAGELRAVQIGSSRTVRVPVADVWALVGLDPNTSGNNRAGRHP